MTFQATPYTLPLLLTGLLATFLANLAARSRPSAGRYPLVAMMVAAALWSFAYAGVIALVGLPAKELFLIFLYIGITLSPAAWLTFALEYTGRERWLTGRRLLLLAIEPAIVAIAVATNDQHHLFWSNVTLDAAGIFVVSTNGIGFWLHAVYSYVLLLIGTVLIVRTLSRSPDLYRWQIATMLIAVCTPWLANFLTLTQLSPLPSLDLTPFAFTITGLMFSLSIVRFRLLAIAPVARGRVFEGMRDAVMVLDRDNNLVEINPAALKIIGVKSTAEVIGKPVGQVLTELRSLVDRYRNVLETQNEIIITLSSNLQPRYFQLTISPLTDERGGLIGRLYVLHEVTEATLAADQIRQQNEQLLRANQELAAARMQADEANRLKSEFLATMSHELRTPLNAIIGFTDVMLAGITGALTPKQTDYLTRITANGERLLGLINDVLDIAKIETTHLELNNQPFLIATMLTNIEEQLRSLADKKELSFSTRLDPNLPPQLQGDPQRLEQILVNLIGNAIRFTDVGGVTVSVERLASDHSRWALVVADTGIGIPADAIAYIFDEFRQVDGSYQRQYGGTGLGLAIVRKLVHAMGGTVQVRSEPRQGSTFTVELPLLVVETPQLQDK